jgi:hypothetical protein
MKGTTSVSSGKVASDTTKRKSVIEKTVVKYQPFPAELYNGSAVPENEPGAHLKHSTSLSCILVIYIVAFACQFYYSSILSVLGSI